MSYRTIKYGFNLKTGEILEADKLFKNRKQAHKEIREKYNTDEFEIHCCECYQMLELSTSKYGKLYFKHQKGANYCLLKNPKINDEEVEIISKIYKAKKSQRHIELTKLLVEKLLKVKGINHETITNDDKFIVSEGQKRKPDVYCEYNSRKLVFEIQLSKLSLRYILNRYNFYRKNGIYLIWILDDFDIHKQGQLEKDIKYLTGFQNFFKLDEVSKRFQLICSYKYPFLTKKNKIQTKWCEKSISINQIRFSLQKMQIYYFNFGETYEIIKSKKARIEEANSRNYHDSSNKYDDYEYLLDEYYSPKINEIIQEIRRRKKRKESDYTETKEKITLFNSFELDQLNEKINLAERKEQGKPILNYFLEKVNADSFYFLQFILECQEIKLSLSKMSPNGDSCLIELYKNKLLKQHFKYTLEICLFKRGYQLTYSDTDFICISNRNQRERDKKVLRVKYFDSINNKHLISKLLEGKCLSVLYIVESAKRKVIIGSALSNWTAFANNAIEHYSEFWEYIDLAFKKYSLYDAIIKSDKKGSFLKKLNNLYGNYPKQNDSIELVIQELYPEIFT